MFRYQVEVWCKKRLAWVASSGLFKTKEEAEYDMDYRKWDLRELVELGYEIPQYRVISL